MVADLDRGGPLFTADQQVSDLRAGRGMGLALAAELNGYPEPLHALELADELSLTPDQRSSIGAALNSMKSETAALGESVIAGETALDRLQAVTPRRRYRQEARLAISE